MSNNTQSNETHTLITPYSSITPSREISYSQKKIEDNYQSSLPKLPWNSIPYKSFYLELMQKSKNIACFSPQGSLLSFLSLRISRKDPLRDGKITFYNQRNRIQTNDKSAPAQPSTPAQTGDLRAQEAGADEAALRCLVPSIGHLRAHLLACVRRRLAQMALHCAAPLLSQLPACASPDLRAQVVVNLPGC